MAKPSQYYVDISAFPANEQAHIIDLAQKHNNLCMDVDAISGETPQEKQEFHGLIGWIRKGFHFLHGKRFQVLLALATVHYGLGAMKQLGLNPDQASRLLEAVVKIVEKFANQ